MKTISQMAKDLTPLVYNPNLTQVAILNSLRDVANGESIEIVDPGNPFIFLVDNAVALSNCAIEHSESNLRRAYPIMATTMDELYAHMSDFDYLDMFAQPANATWTIMIGRDELKNYAVPRDSMGVRKLVIPRDTEFTVAGYTFTLQYAIELRQMPHGGVQIVYDTTTMSPIRQLDTNTLKWRIIDIPFGGKPVPMIVIEVPVLQYKIDTYNETIIAGTTFKRNYSFGDKFFTARVWLRDRNNVWKEINTTYAPRVINPDVPTAQITVRENNVDVSIPDIYIRNRAAAGDVRIDIYSTKGSVEVDLRQFDIGTFKFRTRDIGNEVPAGFYTPLNTFTNITTYSHTLVTGGRNSLTFPQMKQRLIDNAATGRKIPVSEKQLESSLNDRGFKLTKSIDFVTERIYLASVEMPRSTISTVSTPVGTINGIVETNLKELSSLPTVHDNGKRITITPRTLFCEKDGMVYLEPQSIDDFMTMGKTQLVAKLNENNYLYSPLHFVIDNNSDILTMRPYYMDDARITSKQFVETNSTLMLDVSTDQFVLQATDYGYLITVTTASGESYQKLPDKKVKAQLSFTPRGYTDAFAYTNGKLVGRTDKGERVFEFRIETNMDIDLNHDLVINNFKIAGNNNSPIPLQLDCGLNIIYSVTEYSTPEFKHSRIDDVLISDDRDEKGITQERLLVTLGTPLTHLWSNIRNIVDTIDYARYDKDVYVTYQYDVHALNENGVPRYEIVTVNGKTEVEFVYTHRKGDNVLDETGNPILLHKAGSIINENGKPVIKNPRTVGWRLELFLFDAKYIFSNTQATKDYMSYVTRALLKYLTVDIPEVDAQRLEKTSIFMYPRSNIGQVSVLLSDSTTASISAACKFKLSYFLTSAGRQNDDLLNTIARVSRQVILANLESRTVSVSAIVKAIRDRLGDEIVDVEMTSIGDGDERLYTVIDESDKLTLGKKVIVNPDGTIGIKDDISIGYYRHELSA